MDVSFWLYFAKWLHLQHLFFEWRENREYWAGVSLSHFVCVCCSIVDALKNKEFEKQGFNKAKGANEFVHLILLLVWWTEQGPSRFAPANRFCRHPPRG